MGWAPYCGASQAVFPYIAKKKMEQIQNVEQIHQIQNSLVYYRLLMGKKIKKQSNNTTKTNKNQQQQNQHQGKVMDKKTLLSYSSEQQIQFLKTSLQQLLAQPEDNIRSVDSLFILTKSPDVKVATTALRVLAQVFVGTAPLEPVDIKQINERKGVKITKLEFKVLKFEELLVAQYQRYLNTIKEINSKLKSSDFQGDQQLFRQFKKCLLGCLLKCFKTLWNFNHFKILSQLLSHFIKHQQTKNVISAFLADKNISTFKAKSKVISDIAVLIRQRPEQSLPDDLIKILNNTFIDFRYLQKQAEALKFQKKRMTKKLYRQKALDQKKQGEKKAAEKGSLEFKAKIKKQKTKEKLKVKEEVQKQFAEGQAMLKKKEVVKANSALLQELYYIYFKILTERPNSKFIPDVLEGILSFAHLINIDLTQALISHLDTAHQYHRNLWLENRNQYSLESRLRMAFTAESLLNGPLAVYNMDDLKTTSAYFRILKDVNDTNTPLFQSHFRLIAITTQEVLLKRRQLSQEVAASLLRQIAKLLPRMQIPKLYLLQLIRHIVSKYSRLSRMFEQDNEGYGLYGFNELALDPQATNAINTELVSIIRPLTTTKKKITPYKSRIIELSQRLCRQTFIRVEGFPHLEELLREDLSKFD